MELNYFKQCLVRTPLLPFNPGKEYTLQKKEFREALYIASRDLYFEMLRYEKGEIKKEKEIESLEKTLLKYWLRMQSRTTPFGKFSGISMVNIGDKNNIVYSDNNPSTRLDMAALCLIIDHFERNEILKDHILYYPNDSMYLIGDKIRYIEYTSKLNTYEYQISTVDRSTYLENVIKESRKGASRTELHKALARLDETLENEDITAFLTELVDSKILVSELTPCLTEPDNLSRILDILKAKSVHSPLVENLNEINTIIQAINYPNANRDLIALYEDIIRKIKLFNLSFDYNKIFQVDTKTIFSNAELDKSIVDEVVEAVNFCVKINPFPSKSPELETFKNKFIERYESQMVNLLKVMDSDAGIGYPAYESNYSNSLIESLALPVKGNKIVTKRWSTNFEKIILEKIIDSQKNNKKEVDLSESDFNVVGSNRTYNTFGCLFEVLNNDGLILLNSFGDNSGAKLMSRFSYLDRNIVTLIKQITDKDNSVNDNIIDAELLYLPNPRHGNIIGRPQGVREYDITCLSASDNDENLCLPISDLLVGVVNNRIVLKSSRLNKELNVYHTNAFNYSFTDLPVFKFLGDLQYQRNYVSGFSFSNIGLDHMPRIKYKNVILSLATWTINTKLIRKKILNKSVEESANMIVDEFSLPEKILHCQSDNELYIDLNDISCCRLFIEIIMKNETVIIKEFLFDSKCSLITDSDNNNYRNQFNISLFKN
ncbi:lantibiotic dehydratase family protein [Hymenobacter cellulosivorans]|uniref:Lantibiotic dehydratase family protein n=1 Tax=Hymenobacter cellulosivorans TaxID=2932249 RepID=A0ABY4F6T7_9BACT|nr:lantibiotic dehydratase family protein [Hymenobacter cellulosivorans]UOQ52375.1 lantibiotic dehydratase family protein [Hymenobacter cellulosivorans]